MTRTPAIASLLVASALWACNAPPSPGFQGYVEGEYLFLSSPQGGYLKSLDAPRGSRVAQGQLLFTLAGDPDTQALAAADARAASARQKLENLGEPRRPTEVAALAANLRAAEAALRLALSQRQSQEALAAQNFVARARVDEARAAVDTARAQVDAARQQLAAFRATLGRVPELRGAQADWEAAVAEAAQKRWGLDHKSATAPATGEISETYYRPGEWVPGGAPVTSVLPDAQRRIRFFVPETQLGSLQAGRVVEASCDGCATPIRARIDFVAAQAEYTPPVIYSRGSREKLVFRVEAKPAPEQASKLRPGLPVEVRLLAP